MTLRTHFQHKVGDIVPIGTSYRGYNLEQQYRIVHIVNEPPAHSSSWVYEVELANDDSLFVPLIDPEALATRIADAIVGLDVTGEFRKLLTDNAEAYEAKDKLYQWSLLQKFIRTTIVRFVRNNA